ncbi:MAG: phosphopantetheine-binding protein [Pseudomonadales bacterium]|nr:phosphopantetheine-binding protein [Pseudomonadales bacterium]
MADLALEIKLLIIESLDLEDVTPEDIVDDEPLFVEGLGLDSIDALELGLAIKNKYNVTIDAESEETKKHFASVNSLVNFVTQAQSA